MDPIANLLSAIKNGYLARKPKIIMPNSKIKENLARILMENKFISSFHVNENMLEIELLYKSRKGSSIKTPVVTEIKRISKPGRKVWVTKDKLPTVLNNLGLAIISTSSGLMTARQARELNLGGEVICFIW